MSASKPSKKLSQKEYLKKYLSGDKKKKDKKHKSKSAGKVKIIDDDANLIPDLDIDEELLLTGEDAPQIVGTYIEEKNNSDGKKWRSIVIKDEQNESDEEVKCKIRVEEDLWGPKPMDRRYKDEFSPSRREETDSMSALTSSNKRIQNDLKNTLNGQRRRSRSNECKKKHHNYSPEKKQKKTQERKSPDRNKNNAKITYDSSKHKNRHSTTARHRSSSDQSPPRRRRKSSEGGGDSSKDQSPPRRRRRNSPADTKSHRRRAGDSPGDQSPPRRKQKDNRKEPSPQRRVRRTSSDQSPPRRRVRDKSEDHSRRRRRSRSQSAEKTLDCHRGRRSDSDQSPSRRRGSRQSPPLRRNSFISPLKIKRENSSPDLSPNKNRNGHYKKESDRKFKQEQLSPSQELTKGDRKISERQTSRWEQRKTSRSTSPPRTHKPKPIMTTLEGKRAGLQDAKSLQQENLEFRRREDEIFARMTGEHSGRDAEVQVRGYGRRGRRAREAQELDPEEELRKEAHEKKKQEIYDRWGKGLKQIEAHRAKIDEDMYEGSKPLARHSNDADLEKHLREQERTDDPMLEYMRKKRKDQQKHTNVPIMPTYQGSYPENRFDLRPGYRWDGVDRSNGYEKKWFDKQNEQRAVRDEAYLYSVEDM